MSTPGLSNAGPSAAHFSGNSPARVARRLFNATRPKFFPASILPVLAGTAWGVAAGSSFDVAVFALALFATVCVHAGANVLNDVGDDEIGTDGANEERIYPYTGGSRFIQAGIMSPAGMLKLGIGLLLAAALAGLVLLAVKGVVVLWLGIAGVILAVLYSLGPFRLSGLGLGELAVAVAFGVLPVCGAAWLQSGVVDGSTVWFSLPIAAWVGNILLINEVPDMQADRGAGKFTLPVRTGLVATSRIYLAANLFAAAVIGWLVASNELPLLAVIAPPVLLWLAVHASRTIRNGTSDRAALTRAIESTLAIHTAGSLWLAACVLFRIFFSGS